MRLSYQAKTLVIVVVGALAAGLFIYVQAQMQQAPTTGSETRQRRVETEDTPTNPDNQELVTYPSSQVAFICGPQLKVKSKLNPFPWFDDTEVTYGKVLGKEAPAIAPRVLTGSVTASPNSPVLIGNGTRFLSEIDPSGSAPYFNGWIRVLDGVNYRESRVASVQSDTQLTLSQPWRYGPVRGVKADTHHYDQSRNGWNYDRYYDSFYYDLALTEYVAYYRTGDPAYREYARKIADSWWSSPYIENGTITEGPNNLPPRSMAYAGLMLRALDGRPEMWDYLERQVRATFDNWLKRNRNSSTLFYDIREDGYTQLYAVMLARVLPNQYRLFANGTRMAATGMVTDGERKRAALLANTEDIAINFFGRLQKPDGSWRWDLEGQPIRNIEQPFMVGLYLESAVLLDQLTKNPQVKANLRDQITRSCRHLYRDTYRGSEKVRDVLRYRWRGMFYFWGGGTTSNPQEFLHGKGEEATQGDTGMIRQVRHLNSTIHHAFGYAYAITGDQQYLQMGDEIFDASYGDRVDGLHGLADDGRGKDYAMNFRASGHYLVWRLRLSPGL